LKPAREIRRPQPQVNAVPRVGREGVGIGNRVGKNDSSLIGPVNEHARAGGIKAQGRQKKRNDEAGRFHSIYSFCTEFGRGRLTQTSFAWNFPASGRFLIE
jgi:hypothetical protein